MSESGLGDLTVDAGTVHHLKTIPCLLSNPCHMDEPVLLTLREHESFANQNYARLFQKLIEIVQSSGLILCLVVIDNIAAESSGLHQTLLEIVSPVIQIHCFAHIANLVF
jgi:hypothetical protein